MKCPICLTIDLVMTERQGVEIDYCPKCRGIWLDRGELDKIIERSDAHFAVSEHISTQETRQQSDKESNHHHGHDEHSGRGHHRRKSWLGDLFD